LRLKAQNSTISTFGIQRFYPGKGKEAAEGAPCPPEVAKGTSATNVAEEERKTSSLPKYAALPREVFGADQ